MLLDHRGNEISSSSKPPKAELGELASMLRDDFAGVWVDQLRDFQDEILAGLPDGLKAYKKILDDHQVQSTFQQRRDAVLERPVVVEPGGTTRADRMAAEFMEEVLEHIKWDNVTEKQLFGVFYGYTVAELLHGRDGSYIFPDEIRVRDRSRFRFALTKDEKAKRTRQELRLLTGTAARGEPMPPRKFWWFTTGGDNDDELYGVGLAHYLYWPVYFGRHWTKFALVWGERFAQPTPVGKFPRGTSTPEQSKLLAALNALVSSSAIIIPDDTNIDKFESNRQGEGSYKWFLDRMDHAIAKIVLSQTMTTDAQGAGLGSEQAKVHEGVRDAVVKSDSKLVDESFSRHPVRWYTEWNFPGAAPPTVRRIFDDEEDLDTKADRDQKLFTSGGWVRTQESQDEAYGEGYVRVSTPPRLPGQAPAAEFAEDEPQSDTVDALTGRAGKVMMDSMIDRVRQLLDEAESLEEVRDKLFDEFAEMDADQLGIVLMQAQLTAEVAGRYEAQEGE